MQGLENKDRPNHRIFIGVSFGAYQTRDFRHKKYEPVEWEMRESEVFLPASR